MVFVSLLAASVVASITAKDVSVLVFGDSYGSTGPSYSQLSDMFRTRNVAAAVRSSATGGTAACNWAFLDSGQQMVIQAQKLFPDLPEGPDFVWYTLGANDVVQDMAFQDCQATARGIGFDAYLGCAKDFNTRVSRCTETMLDVYFEMFPKSKVLHTNYDVPCESSMCRSTFNSAFYDNFCGSSNITCANMAGKASMDMYLGGLQAKYTLQEYTTLNMMGTVQKAWGLENADTGKPIMDQGANCEWATLCVHPEYDSPAGIAWGDAFWNLYFSKHPQSAVDSFTILYS